MALRFLQRNSVHPSDRADLQCGSRLHVAPVSGPALLMLLRLLIQRSGDTSWNALETDGAKYQADHWGICLSDPNRCDCLPTVFFHLPLQTSVVAASSLSLLLLLPLLYVLNLVRSPQKVFVNMTNLKVLDVDSWFHHICSSDLAFPLFFFTYCNN